MNTIIRKAKVEDMPSVLELIRELAVFEKEPVDVVEVTVEDLEQEGFGANPQFICFLAEVGAEIVGMALVYFRFSTWKGRTVHLEDLVVKDRYRGHGIGDLLYTKVMQYALEQGVKRVNWVVLGWNEGAIRFYERTGATVMNEWWQVEMEEKAIKTFLEQKK
ncbi:MAG: GNAT family N-acetyltransferase [Bacteroidota bacterium]